MLHYIRAHLPRLYVAAALAIGATLAPSGAHADYWNGTAPFCSGSCIKGDIQLRSSNCGDGKCCWTGHKVLCRPTAAGSATGTIGGGSSGPNACTARETRTECFGIVEVCDNGFYSQPDVWHSCNKGICGACIGFSFEDKLVFTSELCQNGFVARGAAIGDEVCVPPAVRDAAQKDNAAAASRRAPNGGPSGPDTCKQGFVWREATPADHVCVTPQTRTDTAAQNQSARTHVVNAGKPYGPDTCKQGFVWREAITNDHVCVPPATRDLARQQNAQAAARKSPTGGAFGSDTCKQGFVWREVIPSDHVCVPSAERDQALSDAFAAHDRRAN